MEDVRWLDNDERDAWLALVSVLVMLPPALDTGLQSDSGMRFYEHQVLSSLSQATCGTLRLRELAHHTNGSLSRLSQVATRLEARGWIRRSPDTADGRCTLAALTPAGQRALDAAAPRHAERVRRMVLDPLTSRQVRQLRQICLRLSVTHNVPLNERPRPTSADPKEIDMILFRLDASLRAEGSHSRAIADIVEQQWTSKAGNQVIGRHIGAEPIPATYLAAASDAAYTPAENRTDEQRAAVTLAAELVDELASADALLFAAPLYNFGVPQHFKAYVDLVIADPRMGPGTELLRGKPAELVTVRGGNYRTGTPRAGWDHATPWMRRILEDVWGLDLTVTEADFTLVGVNPALDEFKEMAAEMRAESERIAREHGQSLVKRIAPARVA